MADAYFDGEDWQVDLTRTTTKQADDILEKWMGLTLAQTNKVSLEDLQYLPDYDAYYHYHGDTNIPHSVRFYAGSESRKQMSSITSSQATCWTLPAIPRRTPGPASR